MLISMQSSGGKRKMLWCFFPAFLHNITDTVQKTDWFNTAAATSFTLPFSGSFMVLRDETVWLLRQFQAKENIRERHFHLLLEISIYISEVHYIYCCLLLATRLKIENKKGKVQVGKQTLYDHSTFLQSSSLELATKLPRYFCIVHISLSSAFILVTWS